MKCKIQPNNELLYPLLKTGKDISLIFTKQMPQNYLKTAVGKGCIISVVLCGN
jgi:hypothetical protein